MESRAGVPTAHRVLRAGAAACFFGHGVVALIGKPAWHRFFAAAGISLSDPVAAVALAGVGVLDVLVASVGLLRPARGVFVWMALWATWTAPLRPLAGLPSLEALVRAGNVAVPAALAARPAHPDGINEDDAPLPRTAVQALQAAVVVAALAQAALARDELHGVAAVTALLALLTQSSTAWAASSVLAVVIAGRHGLDEGSLLAFIERGASVAAPAALALLARRRR